MKTQRTDADVNVFLAAIPDERRRVDATALCRIMTEVTGEQPVMWGPAIIGFGDSSYTNSTGTHDWFRVGFSPRKANLAIYGLPSPPADLGPHSLGKSCLYIKDLRAVDESVLRNLIGGVS